jgi:hypothetical protein
VDWLEIVALSEPRLALLRRELKLLLAFGRCDCSPRLRHGQLDCLDLKRTKVQRYPILGQIERANLFFHQIGFYRRRNWEIQKKPRVRAFILALVQTDDNSVVILSLFDGLDHQVGGIDLQEGPLPWPVTCRGFNGDNTYRAIQLISRLRNTSTYVIP